MLMGSVTTGLVSFTLISFNRGFSPGFAMAWLKSWLLAYATAIPVILILSPRVQVLVERLCRTSRPA
jgi:hypothetical protein